jgi:hypothetical protein
VAWTWPFGAGDPTKKLRRGQPLPPSFGGFTIPPRNVPGKVTKEGSTSAAETRAIDAQMVWEASYRKRAGVALGGREKCEHFQKICVYSWLLSVPKILNKGFEPLFPRFWEFVYRYFKGIFIVAKARSHQTR